MISDRKRGGEPAWTARARELADQLKASRGKKANHREVLRKLKDNNYGCLADCVALETLEAILREPRVPKTAEAGELVGQLEAFQREGEALRAKAVQAQEGEMTEARARDLLAEAAKIKITCAEIERLKTKEKFPIVQEVPEESLVPLDLTEISLKELQNLIGGKKGKKKVDDEISKKAEEVKEDLERLIKDLSEELSKSYSEIGQTLTTKLNKEFEKVGFKVEDVQQLDLKVQLAAAVGQLCTHLADRTDLMDEETTDASKRLKTLMERCTSHYRYVVDVKLLRESKEKIQDLVKRLKLKDDSLKAALDLVDSAAWLNDARKLSNDPGCDQNDIDDLLARKPKSLQAQEIISDLNSKAVTSTNTGEGLEKDIHSAILSFLDKGEDLLPVIEDFRKFIERTKKKQINERITKMIGLSERIIDLYENSNFVDCDQVIEDMFEQKFYGTKTFGFIEELQKNGTMMKHDVTNMTHQIARSKKANEKLKNRSYLAMMREQEKVDVTKARDMLASISNLPPVIQRAYSEFTNQMMARIEGIENLKSKLKDLKNKYAKNKSVAGKSDLIANDFDKVVKEYCQLDLGCEELKKELEKCTWMVKAFHALEGKVYDGSTKTLEGWKKIIENIGDWGDLLAHAMDKKYQIAKHFVKEIEKMKQASSNPKADKEKLLTLNEADNLLKEINKNCKEIDLNIEKTYLENILSGVQTKLKVIQTDQVFMLHDLQNSLDYLKRSPLNLKEEMSSFLDIEKKAGEFLQKVRELSPEQFIQKRDELQTIYENLGVKVMEWEDMISSVVQEEKTIEKIRETLKSEVKDVNNIQDIREQYKNIRYIKDIKMEVRLMSLYLETLRNEYEKRQDLIIHDESVKACIDFIMLGVLVSELDDLQRRLKNQEDRLKPELIILHENQRFFHELYAETKRYLELNVYNLSLEQLNSQPSKKLYKKFVDVRGPTLDHKINLEIQEREKHQAPKAYIPPPSNLVKRQPLVIESKYNREREAALGYLNENAEHYLGQADDRKGLLKTGEAGKLSHHPFRDEPESIPIKPTVNRSMVNEELRSYYCKNWKKLMESNPYLEISGLDALMSSKSLEKAIYDRIKKSPLEYDVLCTSITNTLRHILQMKNISTHLRNEAFKPGVLLLYCDKSMAHLRKMENSLRLSDAPPPAQFAPTFPKRKPFPREEQQETIPPHLNRPTMALEVGGAPEESNYKNYNIFTGSFQVDTGDSVRPFDSVGWHQQRISQFTEIPKKTTLSTKVGRSQFAEYITNVIQKPQEYKFLSGWVTYKKNHGSVSSYLQKHDCVASLQYSQNCKIFVFLVNFMKPEWLQTVAIYTTTPRVELMYFLVYKKKAEQETGLIPHSVPLTSASAYRFVLGNDKIGLKPSSIDRILENKRPAITANFADKFDEEEDDDDKKEDKQKTSNKLQFLIDQGDQIKKVPTFLIEEEARNERNKLAVTHFEEESIDDDEEVVPETSKSFNFGGGYPGSHQKHGMFEDKPNAYGGSLGGDSIDKEEFVKNAVSQIQIPIQTILAITKQATKMALSKIPSKPMAGSVGVGGPNYYY